MSPRTGRPKSDNPKSDRLEIRMTKEESERLIKCSKELGISRTDVLMKGLSLVESELKK